MASKSRRRTDDVELDTSLTFNDLHLSKNVIIGLDAIGIQVPSKIQRLAIPIAMSGFDLIAQAKVGTGKTLAFVIPILEMVQTSILSPQALILAPTREIALQINSVFKLIANFIPNLRIDTFVGGLSVYKDIQKLSPCHIVIGSPGRICQLISDSVLRLENIKVFVVDEVDRVWSNSKLFDAVNFIIKKLPPSQFLAYCATLPTEVLDSLKKQMKDPYVIKIEPQTLSLKGVHQYFQITKYSAKIDRVCEILSQMSFHQCLIFCNNSLIADELVNRLNREGWPSARLAGHFSQKKRIEIMNKIREFSLRVLVSTDLISRGVDIERINLLINLDISSDPNVHLHRIGRTGRFGTYGIAINLVTKDELDLLRKNSEVFSCNLEELPSSIPSDFYYYELQDERESLKLNKFNKIRDRVKENLDAKRTKILESEDLCTSKKHNKLNRTSNDNLVNHKNYFEYGNEKLFLSNTTLSNINCTKKLDSFYSNLSPGYLPPPPPLHVMTPHVVYERYINHLLSTYIPNLWKNMNR